MFFESYTVVSEPAGRHVRGGGGRQTEDQDDCWQDRASHCHNHSHSVRTCEWLCHYFNILWKFLYCIVLYCVVLCCVVLCCVVLCCVVLCCVVLCCVVLCCVVLCCVVLCCVVLCCVVLCCVVLCCVVLCCVVLCCVVLCCVVLCCVVLCCVVLCCVVLYCIIRSQVVSSQQPKLGLTQELSFSRISESTTGYTFTPCVGSFTSPGIDTR